ncbi:MAG TPA: YqjD family protein [Paenalcaligenes sp.]|nr:YqjD family protein [Paenalcaligenes sp.]
MVTKRKVEELEDDFVATIRSSLDEAEKLLVEAASASGDKAVELRENALRSLRNTRERLHDTQEAVLERGRQAVKATDHYVHDNPWQAIGVAGIVGLLFGLLVGRR